MKIDEGQLIAYHMENGDLIHLVCRESYRAKQELENKTKSGIGNYNGIEAGIHAGHPKLRFGVCSHCHKALYDEPNKQQKKRKREETV